MNSRNTTAFSTHKSKKNQKINKPLKIFDLKNSTQSSIDRFTTRKKKKPKPHKTQQTIKIPVKPANLLAQKTQRTPKIKKQTNPTRFSIKNTNLNQHWPFWNPKKPTPHNKTSKNHQNFGIESIPCAQESKMKHQTRGENPKTVRREKGREWQWEWTEKKKEYLVPPNSYEWA